MKNEDEEKMADTVRTEWACELLRRKHEKPLLPVLQDPAAAKDREVLLPGMKPNEYAIMNRDWRYIHYADGGEELYRLEEDPNEWHNLASRREHAPVVKRLKDVAPNRFAQPLPSYNEIRLVVDGETFHWESRGKQKERAGGASN
jgi:hypothetical protein